MIDVKRTDFNSEYFYSEKVEGENGASDYIRHNISVWNEIIIDGVKFVAEYATGVSHYGNNFRQPREELEFFDGDGAMCRIAILNEDSISDNVIVGFALDDIKEDMPMVDTPDKLYTVWRALRDNCPDINDFLPEPDDLVYRNDNNED